MLDQVTAACLGITCKILNAAYKKAYIGIKVPLDAIVQCIDIGPAILKNLLRRYEADLMYNLAYDTLSKKLVSHELQAARIKLVNSDRMRKLREFGQAGFDSGEQDVVDLARRKLAALGEAPADFGQ
jgi:hypothetical protein